MALTTPGDQEKSDQETHPMEMVDCSRAENRSRHSGCFASGRARHLGVAFGAVILTSSAVAAPVALWDGVRWGESSSELVGHLDPQAKSLSRPIEFGDSYVDVVARKQMLGGFAFTIIFQMDKTTRGLKRVMLERQRHGANPKVYRAVVTALEAIYGPPARACDRPAAWRNGYQVSSQRIWRHDDLVIRATFRDTTIEAKEGCLFVATMPCGLTGQLFIQISPPKPGADACR